MKTNIKKTTPLTIGQLAKKADVHVETIRYYQRQGLISTPAKPGTGYRVYPVSTLERLQFIRRAKTLGFTLTEIKSLLVLNDQDCEQVQVLAQEKLLLTQKKITDLQAIQTALETLLHTCQQGSETDGCPIIQTLNNAVEGI